METGAVLRSPRTQLQLVTEEGGHLAILLYIRERGHLTTSPSFTRVRS